MSHVLRAFSKFQHVKSKSNISSFSRATTGDTCFSAEEATGKVATPARSLRKITTSMMTVIASMNQAAVTRRGDSLDSMDGEETPTPVFESSHACRQRMQEILGELGIDGLHTELVLKLDSLRSNSRERSVVEDIAWFRDVLLKEAWGMVGAAVAEHKAATARALEKASDVRRRQFEMEAAYLHETTSLRDQMRTLPKGVEEHLNMDVSFFEPLKYLDESTRAVVQACVEEKVKQIFAGHADIWNDPNVKKTLEARIAERCAAMEKRLGECERARADLEREKSGLEASVRDFSEQVDVMEQASRITRAERAEQEAAAGRLARDLAEAREELRRAGEELERQRQQDPQPAQQAPQAAPAEREEDQSGAHAQRTLDDAASQLRAACLNATMENEFMCDQEPDCHPVPDSQGTGEDWSLLRGASSGVILAHATEVKDKLESKAATATSLLGALQQLGQQLDTESLTAVADTQQDVFWETMIAKLLPVRMGVMRQESAAIWQLSIFLAGSLQKLGETSDAKMGVQLKARTLAQQLADTASTAESLVLRCFETMRKSWLHVDDSRRQLGTGLPSVAIRKPSAASGGDMHLPDTSQSALLKRPSTSSTRKGSATSESESSDTSVHVSLPMASNDSLILGKQRRSSGSGKPTSVPTTPQHIANSLPITPTSPSSKAATPRGARGSDKGALASVARAVTQQCKPASAGGLHGRRGTN